MPSFNTFTKLNSVTSTGISGSPRDKIRQLASSANGIASIADEFLKEDPNSRSLEDSTGVRPSNYASGFAENGDVMYFPYNLASSEYPAWVQISMYKRETLAKNLDDTQIRKSNPSDSLLGKAKNLFEDTTNTVKAYGNTIGEYSYDGSRMDLVGMVCLPLQAGMGINNTGVEIAAEEVGSGLGQLVKNGTGIIGGDIRNIDNLFGEQLKQHVISAPVIGNALQLSSGRVINPYSFQLFKGVKHRVFNFTFNLVPTNSADSTYLQEIVRILESGMLPENNGFTFSYPYEFKIDYYYMNEQGEVAENPYYPKTGFCYLQNVSDTPNDQVDSIHADGAPISKQIQLDFSEIEPMDKAKHKILNPPRF